MNTTENSGHIKAAGMDTNRKIMLGLAGALIVVAVGMYAWKSAAVGAVEDKMAELQAQQIQARADLIEQARRLDAQHEEASLRRFSAPFAWSIRREMMASNLDQVDQYLSQLVQMEGFQSAVLASPDDKIVVASDRKQLAVPFSSVYPAQYLQAKDIMVERTASGGLRSIIPVLGLNQQLGTLVLEYAPRAYPLK